jgi:hypothetical protein
VRKIPQQATYFECKKVSFFEKKICLVMMSNIILVSDLVRQMLISNKINDQFL